MSFGEPTNAWLSSFPFNWSPTEYTRCWPFAELPFCTSALFCFVLFPSICQLTNRLSFLDLSVTGSNWSALRLLSPAQPVHFRITCFWILPSPSCCWCSFLWLCYSVVHLWACTPSTNYQLSSLKTGQSICENCPLPDPTFGVFTLTWVAISFIYLLIFFGGGESVQVGRSNYIIRFCNWYSWRLWLLFWPWQQVRLLYSMTSAECTNWILIRFCWLPVRFDFYFIF